MTDSTIKQPWRKPHCSCMNAYCSICYPYTFPNKFIDSGYTETGAKPYSTIVVTDPAAKLEDESSNHITKRDLYRGLAMVAFMMNRKLPSLATDRDGVSARSVRRSADLMADEMMKSEGEDEEQQERDPGDSVRAY